MKIRILSDLHLNDNDINKIPQYDKNDHILTIIAGDNGSNLLQNTSYLRQNFANAIFVEGNYICADPNNKFTLNKLYKIYRKEFPIYDNICFLQNNYKIIDDYVFVGCTLWTDQKFNEFLKISRHKLKLNTKKYFRSTPSLNGYYRWLFICKKRIDRWYLRHCFYKSLRYIKHISKKFSQKKIIVITHYCISKSAINKTWENYPYSNMIASNLDKFFIKLKNIKAIIHGHTHTSCTYNIGDIKVYCNPFGRNNENSAFVNNYIIDI